MEKKYLLIRVLTEADAVSRFVMLTGDKTDQGMQFWCKHGEDETEIHASSVNSHYRSYQESCRIDMVINTDESYQIVGRDGALLTFGNCSKVQITRVEIKMI